MKKVLFILFLLPVLICNAQENEAITAKLEAKYGRTNVSYQSEGFYVIQKKGDWRTQSLCDNNGEIIIPFIQNVNGIVFEKDCIIIITAETEHDIGWTKGLMGLYNNKGKLLLPHEYRYIQKVNSDKGIYLIGKGPQNDTPLGNLDYPKNAKMALYDVKNEKFLTPLIYDYISYQFSEKEKMFLFNIGGKIIDHSNTSDGAIVKGGKWGYLSEDGTEIIPAKYTHATPFKDGIAQVTEKGTTKIIHNPLVGKMSTRSELAMAIDANIPETKNKSDNTFAFIFSNENYSSFPASDYSVNDGKIFTEYCKKTLGIPVNNIRYYEDATFGNIQKAIKQIEDIADVYDGEAKIIFYFSGLGISDAKTNARYLLPSDASLSALSSTAISLEQLCGNLGKLKTTYTLTIIDAPFNGMDKNGKNIAEGRGVNIKNNDVVHVENNMILILGSESGNCYSSKTLGHGLLTFSILNHLNKTSGKTNIKSL